MFFEKNVTIVELNAIINTNAKVGKGCVISVGTIIAHDVVVDYYVHANSVSIVCDAKIIDNGIKSNVGEIISNKSI